jgi:hypothetical protein
MAARTSDMAARSAVDIVRERLGRGPSDGLRLGSPLTAGGLTLVPIFRAGPELEYITLAEAQKQQSAQVTELDHGGAVSALAVENTSGVPVLMIDGEIVIGLKQNRVLNITILVPPKTTLKVPVACVEAGRWRRTIGKARRADYSLSPRIRATKRRSVIQAARAFGKFTADQQAVWEEVAADLGSLGVLSETMAYSDIEKQRGSEIEDRLSQFQPATGQSGVLALVGGQPVALDLFDRPSTLTELWQGLVGSYVAESLLVKASDTSVDVEAAAEWIRRAGIGEASCHQAVGLGETVSISGTDHEASALVVDGVAVHIAAGPRLARSRG